MSRPFEGIQQSTTDGWHEVEQGVHVSSLDHLVNESRFNEKSLAKLIRGGGVAVGSRDADEVEKRIAPLEGMTGDEVAAALLTAAREGMDDTAPFRGEALRKLTWGGGVAVDRRESSP